MSNVRFRDRVEAGRRLGERLRELSLRDPVVLGLPRGGVVVADEVASVLGVPADVFVARKIGHPAQPELGVGAIAEGGVPTYDEAALRRYSLTADDLAPVAAEEGRELVRRVAAYRGERPPPAVTGREAVLVDDGVATGVTARAALQALRARRPERLVFAVPVGPRGAPEQFAGCADDVVVLQTPARFAAVGQWYDVFGQVSDDEVLALLAKHPGRRSR